MSRYLLYEQGSGRVIIEGNGRLEEVNPADFGPDIELIGCERYEAMHMLYVDNGDVKLRRPLDLHVAASTVVADGASECVIGGIPQGVTVIWPDGQIDEVTDGEVRFSVDLPGTYTLTFDAVPFLRQEVTIEAVAAT